MMIRKVRGFTILELMVTLAVMAVLMAIAVPAFRGTMRRVAVSNIVNTMVGDLQFARSEAAMRRKLVTVCRSKDGKVCVTDDSTYDVGYIIYAYDGGSAGPNQTYDASNAAMAMLRSTPSTPDVSIQATDGNLLTFGPTGLPSANGTRTSMQFVFCARKPGTTTGPGLNNNESPGSMVSLGVSGSLINTKLASTANCLPTG